MNFIEAVEELKQDPRPWLKDWATQAHQLAAMYDNNEITRSEFDELAQDLWRADIVSKLSANVHKKACAVRVLEALRSAASVAGLARF